MLKNRLGICERILCEVWSGTFGSCGYLEKAERQEGLCNHFIAAVIVGNGAKVSIDIKETAQFRKSLDIARIAIVMQVVWVKLHPKIKLMEGFWHNRIIQLS